MRDFIHRLYPYQALKLMIQRVQRQRLPDSSTKSHSPLPYSLDTHSPSSPPPFDPVQARAHLVSYFSALKQAATTSPSTSSPTASSKTRQNTTQSSLGFHLTIRPSRIPNSGLGVFLRQDSSTTTTATTPLPAGTIVALYPGTLYRPGEAIFFNSLQNRYILKCNDSIYVDGKPTGLSGSIYRSANGRDNYPGCVPTADTTWMVNWTKAWTSFSSSSSPPSTLSSSIPPSASEHDQLSDHQQDETDRGIETSTLLKNPLAVGQIVNNGTAQFPPNVRYQELDLQTTDCPLELQEFLPNIWYSGDWHSYDHDLDHEHDRSGQDVDVERIPGSVGLDHVRVVLLVTTRPIGKDEELYSTYIE